MEAARRPPSDGAFEALYRDHRHDVYRSAMREVGNPEDAEDVTQIAFLNAYRALARGQRPNEPLPWLRAITRNAARRRYRMAAVRPREVALDEELVGAPAADDGPSAAEIRAALDSLGENQRAVLVLRELEGLSYGEIAERLELSEASVQMLLFRARRAFREQFRHERSLASTLLAPWWKLADLVRALGPAANGLGLATKVAGAVAVAALGTGVAVTAVGRSDSAQSNRPAASVDSARPAAPQTPAAVRPSAARRKTTARAHERARARAGKAKRPGRKARATPPVRSAAERVRAGRVAPVQGSPSVPPTSAPAGRAAPGQAAPPAARPATVAAASGSSPRASTSAESPLPVRVQLPAGSPVQVPDSSPVPLPKVPVQVTASVPSVSVPSVSVPSVSVPSVTVAVPGVTAPAVTVPTVSVPTVSIPTPTVSVAAPTVSVAAPTVSVATPPVPTVSVPGLPKLP